MRRSEESARYVFLVLFMLVIVFLGPGKAEENNQYDQEDASFEMLCDVIEGPYYVWTEDTDQYYLDRLVYCIGGTDNEEENKLLSVSVSWKAGDQWLAEIFEKKDHDTSIYKTENEKMNRPGTAVFEVQMQREHYSRKADVKAVIIDAPVNAIRQIKRDIDLDAPFKSGTGDAYVFGKEKGLWSDLQKCFEVSPEVQNAYSAIIQRPEHDPLPASENGIAIRYGNSIIIDHPGEYHVTAEKQMGNLIFHFPLYIYARGTGSKSVSGDYSYVKYIDGTVDITGYSGNEKDVTIPGELDGYPVYAITTDAFSCNNAIEKITIPGTVRRIDWRAFYHCEHLTKVEICEGVEEICQEAFASNPELSEITLPSTIAFMEEMPFSECPKLSQIIVPSDNRRFAVFRHMLYDKMERKIIHMCGPWTKVDFEIPTGTNMVGESAFRSNNRIKSIIIPSSVKEIRGYAFADCTSLTKIDIPEGTHSIKFGAFYGCSSLTEVHLPSTILFLGNRAFDGCADDLIVYVNNTYAEQYCIDNKITYLWDNNDNIP